MSQPSHKTSVPVSCTTSPSSSLQDTDAEASISLISYPMRDTAPERMVVWKVCDDVPRSEHFRLFDGERRIEILRSGLYRLQLYLEPVDSDASKYYLEVNGTPLPSHHHLPTEHLDPKRGWGSNNDIDSYGTSSSSSSSGKNLLFGVFTKSSDQSFSVANAVGSGNGPIRPEVPFKVANVFEVRLSKWDMVLVRRKSNWFGQYGGRTAFGRFQLQAVRS